MSVPTPESEDLPAFVADAVLSAGPSRDAVDLVKNAFAWKSISTDLMDIAFDSEREPVGVRDPEATRTIELTSASLSVVLEVAADNRLSGQLVPPGAGTAELRGLDTTLTTAIGSDGRFAFERVIAGPVSLRLSVVQTLESQTFII